MNSSACADLWRAVNATPPWSFHLACSLASKSARPGNDKSKTAQVGAESGGLVGALVMRSGKQARLVSRWTGLCKEITP